MAKVSVDGVVSRLNSRGNGFGVREVQEFNGSERTTFWSVFPPKDAPRTVVEGQRVMVEGFLRTRVSERDARFVDHTLNGARLVGEPVPAAQEPAPQEAGWETAPAGGLKDEAPF